MTTNISVYKKKYFQEFFFYRAVKNSKTTTNENNAATTNKTTTLANQCHICDKTFANPHNVKLHIKVDHEQNDISKCPTCNQAFNSQNFLQMHISSVHDAPQSKSHTCPEPLCGKTYAQISHLNLHMKIDHKPPISADLKIQEENNVFKCKYCHYARAHARACPGKKVFGNGDGARSHINMVSQNFHKKSNIF